MALTMSGYPVVENYGDPQLAKNPAVPGTDGTVKALGGLRAGSVATCLLYVAARWHAEVERLSQELGCWGYELRTIRQGSAMSNHAGGAAIDLNAVRHPQGTHGTLNGSQLIHVAAIESAVASALNWGGRWTGSSVDEMHWQVRDGHAGVLVDELAAAIHAGQVPNVPAELLHPAAVGGAKPAPVTPIRPPGGQDHPAYPFTRGDGRYYGPFYGPESSISGLGSHDMPYRAPLAAWQRQAARLGLYDGPPDGIYGPHTEDAAKALQAKRGLTVDGLIGWDTWAAAWDPRSAA
jgi:hypothetical protein